jgi:hypothetical protein
MRLESERTLTLEETTRHGVLAGTTGGVTTGGVTGGGGGGGGGATTGGGTTAAPWQDGAPASASELCA